MGSNCDQRYDVVLLMGPTASGKTALAMALAKYLPVHIVSVDSALVYRGMDIGTAKPTKEELSLYPHALIDICDPKERFSVAQFCQAVAKEISLAKQQGKLAVLVGGTMMYFHALLHGLAQMPATTEHLRCQIDAEAQQKGWPALHQMLAEVDPVSAAEIHPNHSQRIARALAVYRASGRPMSAFRQQVVASVLQGFRVLQVGLIPEDRQWLSERIEYRFRQMLAQGLVDEVKSLYVRGDLNVDLPAIRSVGYRQVWHYLDGLCCYEEMLERGVIATRKLAKRQLTWLRKWPNLHVLPVCSKKEGCDYLADVLNLLKGS